MEESPLPPHRIKFSLWYPFIFLGGERNLESTHLTQERNSMTLAAVGRLDPKSTTATNRPSNASQYLTHCKRDTGVIA